MKSASHRELFPIIDAMVERAAEEATEEGDEVSCRIGCTHCCHLLIEVSWEEASELAHWMREQPQEKRLCIEARVRENAAEAREFFLAEKGTEKFAQPLHDEFDLDDGVYDNYFYNKSRPCPFLEDDKCLAYHVRPTSCRLHMVTSPPELCSAAMEDDDDYEIPERFDQLKEDAAPVIDALEHDGRWGHFGIVVEAVLEEMRVRGEYPSRTSETAPVDPAPIVQVG